jgi:hypothetical protein
MGKLVGAGSIEGGVGEQAKAVDFDQRGGAADQGNGDRHG